MSKCDRNVKNMFNFDERDVTSTRVHLGQGEQMRRFSRRTFLKSTAAMAAAGAVGVPEGAWREAWAAGAAGGTTVSRTIIGTGGTYQKLAYGPGEPFLLRQD